MKSESENAVSGASTLAGRLAAGHPGAPGEVVERHYAEIYRYARVMLRDDVLAEDAVQRAFERAFEALGRYPAERIRELNLRPWLYRITLNVVRNLWRDGRRETPVANMEDGSGSHGSHHDGGARHATWLDAVDALGCLPQRQRTAVALRYLQDMTYAEISRATGWPENTCKTLARRGLARLQVLLEVPTMRGGSRYV